MGEQAGLTPPSAQPSSPVQPTWDPERAHPAPYAAPAAPLPGGPPHAAIPSGSAAYPGAVQAPVSTALPVTKPGIVPLRPLGVGDVIEGAFAALRGNPRTFLGLSLLVTTGIALLAALAVGAVVLVGLAVGDDSVLSTVLAAGAGIAALVTGVIVLSLGQVLSGMLAYPVGEAVLGRRPGVGETWRRTRRHVLPLTGLAVLMLLLSTIVLGVPIGGTVLAFVRDVPALGALGVAVSLAALVALAWISTRVLLAYPLLVLEELGVRRSVQRAWRLTRGTFWRTFGIVLLANILVSVVTQVLSTVVQVGGMILLALVGTMFSSETASTVLGIAVMVLSVGASLFAGLVTTPFVAAVYALLAIDNRIRLEGFDLALQRAAGR